MDIFESLENLNVSEECFDEIMGIVEELINETYPGMVAALKKKYGEPSYYRYQGWNGLEYEPNNKAAKVGEKLYHSQEKIERAEKKAAEKSSKKQAEIDRKNEVLRKLENGVGRMENYHNDRTVYKNKKGDTNVKITKDENQERYTPEYTYTNNPKYNQYKKIARKALRGHEQEGTTVRDPEDLNYSGISSPKELYKIGRAVHRHQNK